MLHIIYLYVSKVDQGVAHVAIHAGAWRTLACRSRLVLRAPPWFTCGHGMSWQTWCYCRGSRCEPALAQDAMRAGVGAGAELKMDGRCLWSRIWRGAKGFGALVPPFIYFSIFQNDRIDKHIFLNGIINI
jgi:hypothetical protein